MHLALLLVALLDVWFCARSGFEDLRVDAAADVWASRTDGGPDSASGGFSPTPLQGSAPAIAASSPAAFLCTPPAA